MEFLLLWVDEIDDAISATRHLAPRILALVAAFALFIMTGFALVIAPQAALAVMALILCTALIDTTRRMRLLAPSRRDS